MAKPKTLMFVGIGMVVFGIAALILALTALPVGLDRAKTNALRNAVVVDSPSASRYDEWAGKTSIDNEYIQYYYAYNLTNPAEVLAGTAKPNYVQVGPFNYRYYWTYQNVNFTEGGELATYQQQKYYIFNNETSAASDQTLITNINPTFIGLVELTKAVNGEGNFIAAAGGPQLAYFLKNYFGTVNFIMTTLGYNGPTVYKNQVTGLLASLAASQADPIAYYYDQWANAVATPTSGVAQLWTGLLPCFGGSPSGITATSANLFLNETNPLSINNPANLGMYLGALSNNVSIIGPLLQGLQMTPTQFGLALNWYFNVSASHTFALNTLSYTFTLCGLNTSDPTAIQQVGLCQALTGKALNGVSVKTFPFNNQLFQGATPEIELSTGTNFNWTIPQFVNNMGGLGANSLGSIAGVQALSVFMLSGGTTSPWGINATQAQSLFFYFAGLQGATYASLVNIYNNGGGLIATKTVADWLWNCNDPLLNFLNAPIPCGLQKNNTLPLPTTIHTGKNDLGLTNFVVAFQGQDYVPWAQNITVSGFSESGQFAPDNGAPPTLTIFEENVYRPMGLIYDAQQSIDDIKCNRYILANSSFLANYSVFYNKYDGMANITSFNNGVPTFVTLWDMFEVTNTTITNQTVGQNPSYQNASIPLVIEPTSGNALYYNLKLQLNFKLPDFFSGWITGPTSYYANVHADIFFPSWKIGQTGNPSQSTLDDLKSALKKLRILKIVPVAIMAIVGGLIALAGAFIGVKYYRFMKRDM